MALDEFGPQRVHSLMGAVRFGKNVGRSNLGSWSSNSIKDLLLRAHLSKLARALGISFTYRFSGERNAYRSNPLKFVFVVSVSASSLGGSPSVFANDLNVFQRFDREIPNDDIERKMHLCRVRVHKWGNTNRVAFDPGKEHIVIQIDLSPPHTHRGLQSAPP